MKFFINVNRPKRNFLAGGVYENRFGNSHLNTYIRQKSSKRINKKMPFISYKNGAIYQGEYIKLAIKWKWTEHEYHVLKQGGCESLISENIL